jgi:hypothetical protein
MAQDEPAMSAEVGPDGRPPRFDGAAWVSQDGRYWWNGAGWQPVARRRGFRPSGLVLVLAVFIIAAVGYMALNLAHRVNEIFAGEGVSNAKIDSSTEFEFDYLRASTCNDLTFQYDFFDKSSNHVDVFHDTTGGKVDAGVLTHFDIKADASQPIDSRAVRFEAKATCHD